MMAVLVEIIQVHSLYTLEPFLIVKRLMVRRLGKTLTVDLQLVMAERMVEMVVAVVAAVVVLAVMLVLVQLLAVLGLEAAALELVMSMQLVVLVVLG
jgi:hypothetical protein